MGLCFAFCYRACDFCLPCSYPVYALALFFVCVAEGYPCLCCCLYVLVGLLFLYRWLILVRLMII